MAFGLRSKVRDLEERLEKTERQVKTLGAEWMEVQDRVNRWMHRALKRQRVDLLTRAVERANGRPDDDDGLDDLGLTQDQVKQLRLLLEGEGQPKEE